MSEINFSMKTKCTKCGEELYVGANVNPIDIAPQVRSKMRPVSDILVYKITSDDMKNFIIAKAKKYCPDVKIEIVPRYCEKKRRRDAEPHRAYASLRIAFSEHILEKKEDLGWYGKIGDSSDNLRIQPTMFQNIINMYKYNPKDIDAWTSSYKTLEELEETLGINESFIKDIREYSRPQRVRTNNNDSWIFFSAAAENVIKDMLTDPTTQKVPGRIQIQDVYQVSNDTVEFIVYLHPGEVDLRENPNVRRILTGEDKPKK